MLRVVGMRLKLEEILFITLYHLSDGSYFTSVSICLQYNSLWCQWSIPWGVRMRASHKGPKCTFSHREAVKSQGSMGVMVCHGNQLDWTFEREVNSTCSGTSCFLHNNGSFPEYICHFRVNAVFQHCITRIHSIKSHLERQLVNEKDSLPK